MFKKHALSENHKVVTSSKHNFHQNGTEPTTAGKGAPPQELHGGADGPAMGGDGTAGPVDGFCNGGMKYADGGNVYDKVVDWTSRHVFGADDYEPNKGSKPVTPLAAGNRDAPYEGSGGADAEKTLTDNVDKMSR